MTSTNKDSKILLDRDLDNQSTPSQCCLSKLKVLRDRLILRGGAIQVLGTKRHHGKWLRDTENYAIMGCFAMFEGLKQIRILENLLLVLLANQLRSIGLEEQLMNNQGVHALIAQIRDENGNVCPGVRIADCGHKIGLNGVDNGRICLIAYSCILHISVSSIPWLRGFRNMLTVADVSPNGKYLSATFGTWDGTERSGTRRSVPHLVRLKWVERTVPRDEFWVNFHSTSSPGTTCSTSMEHKIITSPSPSSSSLFPSEGIFAPSLFHPVLSRPIPSHSVMSRLVCIPNDTKDPDQRFAAFMAPLTWGRIMCLRVGLDSFRFGTNGQLLCSEIIGTVRRMMPEPSKAIHVVSSAFRATHTWHNMRTLQDQECREACGGQGLKTENRVGHLKSEYDVESTYEGDNNVLLQQVSKALLLEYIAAQKGGKPFKALELEHMNKPRPMDAFCLRERDLLNRFAMEVSQHQKQGESKEYSVIRSYQLAEDLGRAFSDRAMLQTFIDAEAALPAGSLKGSMDCSLAYDCSNRNVLALLRSMYAWICLEEDAAFLRYGYLSTNKVAAVRNEVSRLCGELRPHALALVSSFGIPDAFLSPIAFNWIHSNSWSSVEQHKSTVSPKIPHPSL
ncbi:unnamed protein product [Malus baccata var. baccata]